MRYVTVMASLLFWAGVVLYVALLAYAFSVILAI